MAEKKKRVKRWLRERYGGRGKKPRKRRVSWKPIAKIIALCAIFAIALIVALILFGFIPGFDTLPALVTLGVPLGIAWLIAAGVGQNLVSTRGSLALATICLLVAAPIAWYGPWRAGLTGEIPAWEPEPWGGVENVPENAVAFRWIFSFTYQGSTTTNGPITGVTVGLTWPYVDAPPASKPVGVPENYLTFYENFKEAFGYEENYPFVPDSRYWLTSPGGLGLDYHLLECPVTLRLYQGDTLEVENGGVVQLIGKRNSAPNLVAYVVETGAGEEFQRIQIEIDRLYPGETVAVEAIFQVPEENADRVRLDDYWNCRWDEDVPGGQENAPTILWEFSPGGEITATAVSRLEKQTDAGTELVVKYEEWGTHWYTTAWTFIDDRITR